MLRRYRDLVAAGPLPLELPSGVRDRLLAIPAAAPLPRPGPVLATPVRRPSLLVRSPALVAMASYVLMLGLSLLAGNPYQLGRSTLAELRSTTDPIVARGLDLVESLQGVGASLEAQIDATLGQAQRLIHAGSAPERNVEEGRLDPGENHGRQ